MTGQELGKSCGAILLASVFIAGGERSALAHDPGASLAEKVTPRRQVRLPIGKFSLTDQTGKPFAFDTLRGKLVLVGFIYTTCPDVCPLMTASMRLVQDRLKPGESKSVHLLSITTDPEVDTPEVLASYARRYKVDFSNWSFLTGDEPALSRVWKLFGVKVQRKARGLVAHTPLTALVDGAGAMRFAYYDTSPDQKIVLRDIRRLLDNRRGP